MAGLNFIPPPLKTQIIDPESGELTKVWIDWFYRLNRALSDFEIFTESDDSTALLGSFLQAVEQVEALARSFENNASAYHQIEALSKQFESQATLYGRLENLEKILELSNGHNHVSYIGDLYQRLIVPASINLVAGGVAVGTVSDTQIWNDGNVYQVPEVAATPGFDIQFTITGVRKIARIASNIFYDGTATHHVELQIYNNTTTNWDTLIQVPSSLGYNLRYFDFPLGHDKDYINATMQVLIRLYHVTGGNASHDIYVDYLAVIN